MAFVKTKPSNPTGAPSSGRGSILQKEPGARYGIIAPCVLGGSLDPTESGGVSRAMIDEQLRGHLQGAFKLVQGKLLVIIDDVHRNHGLLSVSSQASTACQA